MYFLIGPLSTLGMKFYYIAVTNSGFHFHRLNMFNRIVEHDYFDFGEIKNIKIGKGFIQRPIYLTLSNGRRLKLKAQLKGAKSIPKLTPEIQKVIEDKLMVN